MSLTLFAFNDFVKTVTIEQVDAAGAVQPVSTGTVTAFLATSKDTTAVAAHASLSTTAVYTGAGGIWLITLDAAVLTQTLLDTYFATTTPYLIVSLPNGIRVYAKVRYKSTRPATVT